MEIKKSENGDFYIIKHEHYLGKVRARVAKGSDDPLSDAEILVIKLCDELVRIQEKQENKGTYLLFNYDEILKKTLGEILSAMKTLNADSTALKLCNEKDEVIAGVFVVTGETANEVANKIDFICEK